MKTIELEVTGMTCGHCVSTVQSALTVVEGVEKAAVSLGTQRAVVRAEDGVEERTLVEAVEQSGYGATLAGTR